MRSLSTMVFFTLVLFLWSNTDLRAVDPCDTLSRDDRRAMAVEWIDQLSKNGMVIILESNRRQIEHLENNLENAGEREDRRTRQDRKRLEEIQTLTRERSLSFMQAFDKHFDFADVYYTWDFNLPHLRNNPDTALLLDDHLDYSPEIRLKNTDEVFFMVSGSVPQSRGSGLDAFMIRNVEYRYLCPPFPYYLARNDNWFLNALASIFFPDAYGERSHERVAEIFQERFKNFKDSSIYEELSPD